MDGLAILYFLDPLTLSDWPFIHYMLLAINLCLDGNWIVQILLYAAFLCCISLYLQFYTTCPRFLFQLARDMPRFPLVLLIVKISVHLILDCQARSSLSYSPPIALVRNRMPTWLDTIPDVYKFILLVHTEYSVIIS
jgi:hypothetical protein